MEIYSQFCFVRLVKTLNTINVQCLCISYIPPNLSYKSHQIPKFKHFSPCPAVIFAQSIEARSRMKMWLEQLQLHLGDQPGLDTYFFLNLSIGQPSNNMDLSEIEIHLGTMIIFFLFRKKKKSGRTVYLYICIFNFYFKITVSEAHCHIINHWCSSLVEVFLSILTSQGPGIHFNGYKKCITSNILIQNVERSKMYSLYSAHVMSCHCCMFTENHHFDIFGIEWERNIIITVISDHLSHALNRWLVYFSFTKLIRRPNGHVTAATVHYHVCRAAALVLEI